MDPRLVLAAALVSLTGCAQSTGVLVRFDAHDETELLGSQLRVRTYELDGTTARPRDPIARDHLPFTLLVTPLGGDASRRFRVEADLLDLDDEVVGTVRADATFTAGAFRVLPLCFEDLCRGVSCGATETCSRGLCVPAAGATVYEVGAPYPPCDCTEGCASGMRVTCSSGRPTRTGCPSGTCSSADPTICGECVEGCSDGVETRCIGGTAMRSTCELGACSTSEPSRCAEILPSIGAEVGWPESALPMTIGASCTIDTGVDGGGCGGCSFPSLQVVPRNGACILVSADLEVLEDVVVTVTGSRALVLLVNGDATIAGTIDAGARGSTPGPFGAARSGGAGGAAGGSAYDDGTCVYGWGGGGAGGCGAGGGGTGNTPVLGGMAHVPSMLAGGSGGGDGAHVGSFSFGGAGGGGGGAMQLVARGAISVSGTLLVGGGGGGGGGTGGSDRTTCSTYVGGGGGGGSGGMIVLEAVEADLAGARLLAPGGGGGQGGALIGGGAGANGSSIAADDRVAGGTGVHGGAVGGDAGACTGATGDYTFGGGGGGGGAAGFIVVRTHRATSDAEIEQVAGDLALEMLGLD